MLLCIMAIQNETDRSFVEQLFNDYGSTMIYVAQSILHDRALAEDAVSAAFVKIIDNLQKFSFKNCKKTKALIVIIVRNISLDMLKSEKRQNTVPIEKIDDCFENTEDSPIDFVLKEETYNLVLSCLSQLNSRYQDVLSLKLFYEFTDEEIAKMLDITPQNVYVRFHRAKKALLKEMRKRGLEYA